MTTDYWIKLYLEILEDPKMATLPDRLWRRVVELFLLAGKFGKSGELPETRQLAWVLRISTDELEMDLVQLASTGIIQKTSTGWNVANFKKRQAPSTSTERSRQHRKRERHEQYASEDESTVQRSCNEDETNLQRNVQQINRLTESEAEAEADAPPASPLLAAFINASKIPEFGPNALEHVKKMQTAGVEPEDITTAVAEMDSKGLSITSIRSIVNPAILVAGKRKRGNGRNPPGEPLPRPSLLCEEGGRLVKRAEEAQGKPNFAELFGAYRSHLDSCQVCGGSTKSDAINQMKVLAQRMSVK